MLSAPRRSDTSGSQDDASRSKAGHVGCALCGLLRAQQVDLDILMPLCSLCSALQCEHVGQNTCARFMKENLVSLVEDMRKVHAQLLFLKRLP